MMKLQQVIKAMKLVLQFQVIQNVNMDFKMFVLSFDRAIPCMEIYLKWIEKQKPEMFVECHLNVI